MTQDERLEIEYIKESLTPAPGYGANLTIRTDASPDYKRELHDFYTSLDFHPCEVTRNWQFRKPNDNTERIIYIKGIKQDGQDWTSLYSKAERELFASKLN